MALTEKTIQDQVIIQQPGPSIMVRQTTIIERDGVEVSRSYHRRAFSEWEYDEFSATVENSAAFIAAAGWTPGKLPPQSE